MEYAKAAPDDILMRITVHNRGPDTAPIHILPQAWFRNEWSWSDDYARPEMREETPGEVVGGDHDQLGRFALCFEAPDRLIFCDNDTNFAKVFGTAGSPGYFKDGIDEFVVHGRHEAVNPAGRGTKVAGVYQRSVPAGGTVVVRVRLQVGAEETPDFAGVRRARGPAAAGGRRLLCRAASGHRGRGHAAGAAPGLRRHAVEQAVLQFRCGRMAGRRSAPAAAAASDAKPAATVAGDISSAADIISMPDKWEYPWFAAWDLASIASACH